jgi:hypothetical protein
MAYIAPAWAFTPIVCSAFVILYCKGQGYNVSVCLKGDLSETLVDETSS